MFSNVQGMSLGQGYLFIYFFNENLIFWESGRASHLVRTTRIRRKGDQGSERPKIFCFDRPGADYGGRAIFSYISFWENATFWESSRVPPFSSGPCHWREM